MTREEEIKKLEAEVALIQELSAMHQPAWTGSLDKLQQRSYVSLTDMFIAREARKRRIRELTKQ